MEIKNLKKAAKRILSAIKKDERIILFGDADLDGTTSVIILEEAIKSLNGKTLLYFPERGIEGYGLNEDALGFLGKYAPALIILLDCGIGNYKEVKEAKKMGFEVIIIDHHEVLDGAPPAASIVVDPKQKGDKYPFKLLANCGLSFKLVESILEDKMSKNIRQSFLELVALGTIADMMPQTDDNKDFITEGLSYLSSTFRPGLAVFLKFSEPVQKIISVLQITDVEDHLTEGYLLLTAQNLEEAVQLLNKLFQKSLQRRELIKELAEEISQKVSGDSSIIFEGDSEFPHVLTGAVASRICNKFKKPTFIFNINKILTRGSVRTPKGINSIEALKHCHSLLEVYGGHPPASGFTAKNENLMKFRDCLIEYFKKL